MYADEIQKLQAVAGYLGLSREELDYLSTPEKVVEAKIAIKTSAGLRMFHAFRSQHNSALGPYKGGIRFASSVNYDEVVALSMAMTWKSSLLKLPYGGGKGGVNVDPKLVSQEELEQIARKYVDVFFDEIGEDLDVPAPDVNTNPQMMAWMIDEYQKLSRDKKVGVFTGKPEILGGISAREYRTCLRVAVIT
jgi:glutamate dehydrogenase (NAD(P)+)